MVRGGLPRPAFGVKIDRMSAPSIWGFFYSFKYIYCILPLTEISGLVPIYFVTFSQSFPKILTPSMNFFFSSGVHRYLSKAFTSCPAGLLCSDDSMSCLIKGRPSLPGASKILRISAPSIFGSSLSSCLTYGALALTYKTLLVPTYSATFSMSFPKILTPSINFFFSSSFHRSFNSAFYGLPEFPLVISVLLVEKICKLLMFSADFTSYALPSSSVYPLPQLVQSLRSI